MLTAQELCDVCQTTTSQRRDWAKAGDLRQRRGNFEEFDAVELVAYARLREAAGPKRGRAAWRDLRKTLLAATLEASTLWVVVRTTGVASHALASRSDVLAEQVQHGRPIVVVDILSAVNAARAGYRDALARKREGSATVHLLERSG